MKLNWSEYLSEFFGTAIMMAIGIGAVVFMWSAGSVMTEVIPSEPWRRLATGVLFAGGGTAVVLSPLGQRSGGHLNPAMTLAFLLRGKITHTDAAMYVLAQTLGAVLAVGVYRGIGGEKTATGCAKLHHTDQYPCLFEGCGYRRIAAGTILLREGGESDRAYVIRRGEVEVRKAQSNGQEAVIAQLGPGDWVGEMGLLLNLPRSASVVAVTDLEVEPLTRENFEHLIGAHPEEALRLLRQLATRLHQADQRQTL
jgi:hypothetical protein